MAFKWFGDKVKRKVRRAAKDAIDETMGKAVRHAKRKRNHPGWKNRTGTAEGSIQIIEFAHREGSRTVGLWGSIGVDYMIGLELKHGSALRSAGEARKASILALRFAMCSSARSVFLIGASSEGSLLAVFQDQVSITPSPLHRRPLDFADDLRLNGPGA